MIGAADKSYQVRGGDRMVGGIKPAGTAVLSTTAPLSACTRSADRGGRASELVIPAGAVAVDVVDAGRAA